MSKVYQIKQRKKGRTYKLTYRAVAFLLKRLFLLLMHSPEKTNILASSSFNLISNHLLNLRVALESGGG